MSFMKKLTVCLSSLEWHRLRNKSFGSISGIYQKNVQVFHLTQSLQRLPLAAEQKSVAALSWLKQHTIHKLISSLHHTLTRPLGFFGEHLPHTSHDRLSKMENKKPRAAYCDIGRRGMKLNESLAFFKKIFVHLPVNRFPLSSFRVEMKTKSFDVYLNIIV
jgi:hypothetical protein